MVNPAESVNSVTETAADRASQVVAAHVEGAPRVPFESGESIRVPRDVISGAFARVTEDDDGADSDSGLRPAPFLSLQDATADESLVEEYVELDAELDAPAEDPAARGAASRRVPPQRPSLRARGAAPSSSTPPPRRSGRVPAPQGSLLMQTAQSSAAQSGSAKGAKTKVDHAAEAESLRWMLADKTLQLGRLAARVADLENQLRFRDARIQTLTSQVEAFQQSSPGTTPGKSDD